MDRLIMKLDAKKFEAIRSRIERGEDVWVTIVSGSMAPCINQGERIRVVGKRDWKVFDIVVYHHRDGRLICHYIWGKSKLNSHCYLLRSLVGYAFDLPVEEKFFLGYLPDKKIGLKWKIFIFFKLLLQRLRRGILG